MAQMPRLGSLELGAVPRVAVGFSDEATEKTVADAIKGGLDIAELRIDRFSDHTLPHVRSVLPRFSGIPTIATIRTQAEGGRWAGSEEVRSDLFLGLLPLVDAVDVELDAKKVLKRVAGAVAEAEKTLIVSHHDLLGTPDNRTLDGIADDALGAGADIVKIAALAKSRDDIQSLARFCTENTDKNLIVIGMGGLGLLTRLFLPALGSLVTFASIGHATAPGQLPFEEMVLLMRKFYPGFDDEKINRLSSMERV